MTKRAKKKKKSTSKQRKLLERLEKCQKNRCKDVKYKTARLEKNEILI